MKEKKIGIISKNKDGSIHITFQHWKDDKHIIDSSIDLEELHSEKEPMMKDYPEHPTYNDIKFKVTNLTKHGKKSLGLLKCAFTMILNCFDYLEPHSFYDEKLNDHTVAMTLQGAILNWLDDLEDTVELDRPEKYQ